MIESPHEVVLAQAAIKQMSRLAKPFRATITRHLENLATNPRPQMAKPLRGQTNVWRLRVGNYRVLYEIDSATKRVVVTQVGHRRDVYRGM